MNNRVNIVLMLDSLAHLAGGTERQIFELAQRVDKQKFNVLIASLGMEMFSAGHQLPGGILFLSV